jgi:hypothetical protein
MTEQEFDRRRAAIDAKIAAHYREIRRQNAAIAALHREHTALCREASQRFMALTARIREEEGR